MTFEQAMSDLTRAIGNVERLEALTPEQIDRLWLQAHRLDNAAFRHNARHEIEVPLSVRLDV